MIQSKYNNLPYHVPAGYVLPQPSAIASQIEPGIMLVEPIRPTPEEIELADIKERYASVTGLNRSCFRVEKEGSRYRSMITVSRIGIVGAPCGRAVGQVYMGNKFLTDTYCLIQLQNAEDFVDIAFRQ